MLCCRVMVRKLYIQGPRKPIRNETNLTLMWLFSSLIPELLFHRAACAVPAFHGEGLMGGQDDTDRVLSLFMVRWWCREGK